MDAKNKIKVALIHGSPRRNGNTEICLRRIEKILHLRKIDTTFVALADYDLRPCKACMRCKGQKKCFQDDGLNEVLKIMIESDGIVIGSPTWFGSVTGWVKNLIDRAGYVSRMNGHLFYRKVGAPVVTMRRGGAVQVYNEIVSFFAINHFYMVGSSYWNFAVGLAPGEVEKDSEGMQTMVDLAENLAHLLKALRSIK
jgi:multimeric flavodoxin WrbA